jgi:hypothetical protein
MACLDDFNDVSALQHAFALEMRNLIHPLQPSLGHFQSYAQDPAYSEIDKRLLEKEGFAILDDPRGFLEVDNSSVVLSIAPNIPVRQIVADIARPALLVWGRGSSVVNSDEEIGWT